MANMIAPPEPPAAVDLADGDDLRRLRFRLWQTSMAVLTILATGWFFSLSPIYGVLAIMVAKHILVAILVMGLGIDSRPGKPF